MALLGQKRHLTDLQKNLGRWLVELANNARIQITSSHAPGQFPERCNLTTPFGVEA
jgi:hypothetical protein